VRQLAVHLGEQTFLDGLRRHIGAHAYANAEFADLIAAWGAAGAVGVTDWAGQWLRTSGVDTLCVARAGEAVELRRRTPAGSPAERPHAITVAAYDADGREISRTAVNADTERAAVPGVASGAALVLPDADDQSWAKIALTEADWQVMPALVAKLPAPARVVVSNALRLAVADSDLDPVVAADTVAALLGAEREQAIIAAMSGWSIDGLVGAYLAPGPQRDSARSRLAEALAMSLADSAPASGRQLAAARGFIAAAADPGELRRWLAGRVPRGLELDADLRWAVVRRLTALGMVSRAELETEAARDRSAPGAVHAARCRALIPDDQAKHDAWRLLTADPDRSNFELYATAEGFWHPQQLSITAPYVPRYFAEIAGTAALRSGLAVGRVARQAYPWPAVAPATVEATDRLLTADGLDPQIRRAVTDAGDDLRRALASRRKFAPESA
jgi:aminopeptidase N